MANTCVCVAVSGNRPYFLMGRHTVSTALKRTNFDIFLATESVTRSHVTFPTSSRLLIKELFQEEHGHRSRPFLLKLHALQSCLEHTKADTILLLDADTAIVADLRHSEVERMLDGYDLGMVEQTTIRGSTMTRSDFLDHYRQHTLAWFNAPDLCPPLKQFRYFNSGVVLGTRQAFGRLLEWAIPLIARSSRPHQIGQHMIADQDYFQYWTNTVNPGCCRQLPWNWNHCQHWDRGFPHPKALIVHYSNFCMGPKRFQTLRCASYEFLLNIKRLLARP
jgi:hypothetical protein